MRVHSPFYASTTAPRQSHAPLTLAAPAQHLRQLVVIRALVLLCLSLATVLGVWLTPGDLPYLAITLILLAMASLNLLSFWRLRQPLPVTELEFFVQLLIDVVMLSTLFYFSGGANNPFISYFLVPVCISAATLSWSFTWALTGLCLLSYSLLLFFHIPLPAISPGHGSGHPAGGDLHVLGMGLNFFISALLITYFVVKMAQELRHQEALLTQTREDDLRDEQLMAVATLAAGTAHELGTPLATMKLLLGELRAEHNEPALAQDLTLLNEQLDHCTQTLQHLVATAEQTRAGSVPAQSLRHYCLQVLERWQIMRPEANVQVRIDPDAPELNVHLPPTLAQALINLLNNATDANPQALEVDVTWDRSQLHWCILDQGPGIPLEIAAQLGKTFVTSKGAGLGLGLFLTHATLNRYGGQVRLYPRSPRGTRTEVSLPLTGVLDD